MIDVDQINRINKFVEPFCENGFIVYSYPRNHSDIMLSFNINGYSKSVFFITKKEVYDLIDCKLQKMLFLIILNELEDLQKKASKTLRSSYELVKLESKCDSCSCELSWSGEQLSKEFEKKENMVACQCPVCNGTGLIDKNEYDKMFVFKNEKTMSSFIDRRCYDSIGSSSKTK
jgi:hypothetical protein